MTCHVTEGTLDLVLAKVSAGSDPLGIGTGMARTHSGNKAEMAVKAALVGLTKVQADRIEDYLIGEDRYHEFDDVAGLDKRQARAIRESFGRGALHDDIRLDLATVEILVARGIDPLAVTWLAAVNKNLDLYDEDDMQSVISFNGQPEGATTNIGEGVWWTAGCVLMARDIPDTIVAAAPGRRLREIVSHPQLDSHPMVVRSVEPGMNGKPARLACRREEWILNQQECQPYLVPHVAEFHDLFEGHLKVVGR